MKKNLRIISASAAALLAIAPVAASTVNTANADVEYGNATTPVAPTVTSNTIGVNVDLGDIVGKDASEVVNSNNTLKDAAFKNVKVTLKTADGTTPSLQNLSANNIQLTDADGHALTGKIEAGKQYQVKITGMKIDNLINSKNYEAAGKGKFSGTGITDGSGLGSSFNTGNGVDYTETFSIFDTKNTTTPYFVNQKSGVQIARNGQLAGNQSLDGVNNIGDLLNKSKGLVRAEDGEIITTSDDLINQLKDNKDVTLTGSGANATIKVAAGKTFTIKLTAQNQVSGKTTDVSMPGRSIPSLWV